MVVVYCEMRRPGVHMQAISESCDRRSGKAMTAQRVVCIHAQRWRLCHIIRQVSCRVFD
jgi:hypothetical protein